MKILGINCGGHDTSAALFVNGKLVCAFEEERFNKEKHSKRFPINSIKECLKFSKLEINDIKYIALSTNPKRQIRKFWLEGALDNDEGLKKLIQYYENK